MSYFIELKNLHGSEVISGGFVSAVQTGNLTVAFTNMKAGVEIPLHHHPEEAVDIVLEGELIMDIGETTETLRYGMISTVPANVPHRAKAITDCKVVTVFNPPRKF